jgi:tRNA A-37 threonylcarbamoyl transferase component Bud32
VHNDIKLENMIVGAGNPNQIFLIDFGLSKTYIKRNGTHKQ